VEKEEVQSSNDSEADTKDEPAESSSTPGESAPAPVSNNDVSVEIENEEKAV
jgi:hypothetical protein